MENLNAKKMKKGLEKNAVFLTVFFVFGNYIYILPSLWLDSLKLFFVFTFLKGLDLYSQNLLRDYIK